MKLHGADVLEDLATLGDVDAPEAVRHLAFTGVGIDSRGDLEGVLFVALRGERFDGHAFVEAALRAGARGALVATASGLEIPPDITAPLLRVADPLHGLQALAAGSLRRHPATVIAITGSSGKTTTKDLLMAALGTLDGVAGTAGNRNNHIGVPLTVLARAGTERFLVTEIGANDFGEIAAMSRLVRPAAALVTNVGRAHLERFGTLDGVCRAKSEIFTGLRPDGLAVLNADDPYFEAMARGCGASRVIAYGFAAHADVRILASEDHADGTQTVRLAEATVHLQRPGRGNARNAAAAFAMARAFGGEATALAAALERCTFTPGRSRWRAFGEVAVLDDTYNANPDSMAEALALLAERRGRRIAVLGDMLELGPEAPAMHAELGRSLRAHGVDVFLGYGELMRHAVAAARAAGLREVHHFESMRDLVAALRERLQAGDALLVKGSRGCRMERVIDALGTGVT